MVETTINTMKEDLGLNVEGSGSQENEDERMELQKTQEELVFIAVEFEGSGLYVLRKSSFISSVLYRAF